MTDKKSGGAKGKKKHVHRYDQRQRVGDGWIKFCKCRKVKP